MPVQQNVLGQNMAGAHILQFALAAILLLVIQAPVEALLPYLEEKAWTRSSMHKYIRKSDGLKRLLLNQ